MNHSFARRHALSIIIALVGVAAALPAAAGEVYFNIPGIVGPVTLQGYVGDIALLSYSQGFSHATGTAGSGAGGKTSCGDISITKVIDSTSTSFLHAAVVGFVVPKATIYFSAGNLGQLTPYTITLTNFIVSSIVQGDTASSSSGLGLTENISLQAQKIQFTFRPQQADGGLGTPVTIGYDCSAQMTF